jgi:hypothetical protein
MTTQVTVVSTKGGVGTTTPAAAKMQEIGPARELDEGDPIEPTPMAVPIGRILEYDRNPRRARNETYVEIETSIRRRGFVGMLPITRRPGGRPTTGVRKAATRCCGSSKRSTKRRRTRGSIPSNASSSPG